MPGAGAQELGAAAGLFVPSIKKDFCDGCSWNKCNCSFPWTQATKDHQTKPEYEDVYINKYTHVCEYRFYIYVCMNITFLQRSEYGNNSANNFQGESPNRQSFYKI